jgi:tRNA 2-thiouridine synthesizing protein E
MNALLDLATVARDEHGYLLEPQDWTPLLAHQLAEEDGLALDDERWYVVTYIRDYYESNRSAPEARALLRHLGREQVSQKATRRYLYSLFPKGYEQQACKIAGLRRPRMGPPTDLACP